MRMKSGKRIVFLAACIMAGGVSAWGQDLYRMNADGSIWEYTGQPCNANGCGGWMELDSNPGTYMIASSGINLYQMHTDGSIWEYTGTPCIANDCAGWVMLDDNPQGAAIGTGPGGTLYQIHWDSSIWQYTGQICISGYCPGWALLNVSLPGVLTAGASLYFGETGNAYIYEYPGTPCSGGICPAWPSTNNPYYDGTLAAGPSYLYIIGSGNSLWQLTPKGPCLPHKYCFSGWLQVDNNPDTGYIAAGGAGFYQMHYSDRSIWYYTGPTCIGNNCGGWIKIDSNPFSVSVVVGSNTVYQYRGDGTAWQYTGTPCNTNGCPGWHQIDGPADWLVPMYYVAGPIPFNPGFQIPR